MFQQEQGQQADDLTAGGVATDAATLNSDAAVGGSVGGGSGERGRRESPLPLPFPPAAAVAAPSPGDGMASLEVPTGGGWLSGISADKNHINAHARQRHYRKRALSTATSSGTIETSGSMVGATNNGNNPIGGDSLMNTSAMEANIMGSSAEHSIVSFGLNFNFDSTSSPSNSDSGDAVNDSKGIGDAGSSEDEPNNNGPNTNSNASGVNKMMKTQAKSKGKDGKVKDGANCENQSGENNKKKKKSSSSHHHSKHHSNHHGKSSGTKTPSPENKNAGSEEGVKASGGSDEGKAIKGSSSKSKNNCSNKKHASVKFVGTGGEGSGSSTSSDSYENNDSGGSASGGSNSGNDGSSGGKSTVSSLTTSSNQEWMATNESAEAAALVAVNNAQGVEAADAGGKAAGENGAANGKDPATKKKDTQSSKKRKKVSIVDDKKSSSGGGNGGGGNEDDDGYKTDEEQWGGNRTGENAQGAGLPAVATHKVPSLLKPSSKKSAPPVEGPPMKQARFLLDHQGHPEDVQSANASAQPLSSLSGSDSAGVPTVTASSGGQTPGLSVGAVTSSTPSSSSGPIAGGPTNISSALAHTGKRKAPISAAGEGPADPEKRKERNAREKERSCRIARQIDDLRSLLSRGGVIVSKGTKSSVLSEAANYINLLQQQQVQWEMDRQAMLQQMQQISANPTDNLQQNQLSMGGLAPNSDAQVQQLQQMGAMPQGDLPGQAAQGLPMNPLGQQLPQNVVNSINQNDYKFIFDNSSVGMAIASLGGAFVDCNSIFSQLSEYTKEEICAMTIFNMTSRQDLQHAFDLISQMITPTLDNNAGIASDKGDDKSSIVLRGAMKKRSDLGLSISLIKGDHGMAKCFCVTLVRILSMETTRPDTVSIEMELPQVWSTKQQKNVGFGAAPAYTAG